MVDLGIDRRGQLAVVRRTCPISGRSCGLRPGAQHLGRQRVAESVRTVAFQPCPVVDPPDDLADRLRRQLPLRPSHDHEPRLRLASRTAADQPCGQHLAGRCRAGGAAGCGSPCRRPRARRPGPLVDVAELQADRLGAAHPHSQTPRYCPSTAYRTNRGKSGTCRSPGVIPARECDEPRNRGRQISIPNKVLLGAVMPVDQQPGAMRT